MSNREYIRVYQSIVDDAKFATIYDDDHHLATWLRLLMVADGLWPASCPIPTGTRRASLNALAEAGLADVSGSRFRIRGLDAERDSRGSKARDSANARWDSERNANAMRTHSDRISPPNAATRAPASARLGSVLVVTTEGGPGETDALDRYYELTQFRPWGQWSGDEIKAAIRDYGDATVQAGMDAEYRVDPKRDDLWKRVKARLAKEADRAVDLAKADRKVRPIRPAVDYAENRRIQAELMKAGTE